MKKCPLRSLPREQLSDYVQLVHVIARRMIKRVPRSVELDDLVSAGMLGLAQALERFNSQKGNRFKSFAEFRIRGAMLDELRSQDWVPKVIRQRIKKFKTVQEDLIRAKGRPANENEIRESLKLGRRAYENLKNAVTSVEQVDASLYSKEEDKIEEVGGSSPTPSELLDRRDLRNYFVTAMLRLDERLQKVLLLYYFEEMCFRSIGIEMEISESRVSQLHATALRSLGVQLGAIDHAYEYNDVVSLAA